MKHRLSREYAGRKNEIKNRLKEFQIIWKEADEKIFSELCFCICTPQSKAVYCDKAVKELEKGGLLFQGDAKDIRRKLKAVRFPNNKARYIVEARYFFTSDNRISIKSSLNIKNIHEAREWLVLNVKGIGLKEASHFLRNVGFGKDLAILDVHILKNMLKYRIIKEIPKSINRKKYYDLEDKLRRFSLKINIPMDELDLLFWSMETGAVFK